MYRTTKLYCSKKHFLFLVVSVARRIARSVPSPNSCVCVEDSELQGSEEESAEEGSEEESEQEASDEESEQDDEETESSVEQGSKRRRRRAGEVNTEEDEESEESEQDSRSEEVRPPPNRKALTAGMDRRAYMDQV